MYFFGQQQLTDELILYSEPQKFSRDGYEEHMQVNHLAPALLSILLLPSLIKGSPSRIINVNSVVSSIAKDYIEYSHLLPDFLLSTAWLFPLS